MVVIGNPFFRVAVPANSSDRFTRYITAAAQTCALHNTSVDHVLRTYSQDAHVATTKDAVLELARTAIRQVKTATRTAFESMHLVHKPAHAGLTIAWAAMYRLQATIRCVSFAVIQGFHFEACALQRLLMEQLAWVAAVRTIPDLEYFEIEPQRCLTSLKRLFPHAGGLYGRLSEKAHITPEQTKVYVTANAEGVFSATFQQRRWALHDAASLLVLADMYIVLCELLVADLLESPSSIKRSRGVWSPKASRPFQRVVKSLGGRLLRAARSIEAVEQQ
jgi:hypothetical protein